MNILQALIQTRNNLQNWVTDNLVNKVDKSEIDSLEFITVDDIDRICGVTT